MMKEILEQPETVRSTLRGRLIGDDSVARLNGLNLSPEDCADLQRINIVACGTSWHSGLVGRQIIEELAKIPVHVEYASEYRYRRHLPQPGTLTIAISQSGETADTLEAMRAARANGSRVVGIVNVVGSTIAREADGGIYLHAGPEIGVASTKAFTSQIVALALLGGYLGSQRGLAQRTAQDLVCGLSRLPDLVAETLELEPEVKEVAEQWADARHALYLGRGVNFPVALEGALKLKEISYIHAEGYPAAEMKHGPIALIDANMPVVFIAPHDAVFDKVVSNVQEVKARGGRVIVLTSREEPSLAGKIDYEIRIPETIDMLNPVLAAIPLQLLAYYIAAKRGLNVDQPRNLAKSVTVE
jgi:glucosamine--fructose-6-phosphate aminotransferase (isomerizing)